MQVEYAIFCADPIFPPLLAEPRRQGLAQRPSAASRNQRRLELPAEEWGKRHGQGNDCQGDKEANFSFHSPEQSKMGSTSLAKIKSR
jgi:hypothetical protein